MGLITAIRDKYTVYRLEQRYTKRSKRTTFASGAVYVDGEYVFGPAGPAYTGDDPNTVSIGEPGAAARQRRKTGSAGGRSAASSAPSSPMSGVTEEEEEEGKGPWGSGAEAWARR